MKPAVLAAAICVAGAGLCSCASAEQSGTPAQRLAVWESGTTYSSTVATVQADVARITSARAGAAPPATVAFDCATLGQDVNQYYLDLPTPDPEMSLDLSNAYAAYFSYVNGCVNGKGAPAALAALVHYLTSGNGALAAAQQRSKAVMG